MRTSIYLFGFLVPGLMSCAHQSETPSAITGEERDTACQLAKRDKELFCHETSVSRTFRDAKCWEAKRNIKKYCGKENTDE